MDQILEPPLFNLLNLPLMACLQNVGEELMVKFIYTRLVHQGGANAGNEPYSEYYACQIANRMGINHVDYNLKKWKGKICSSCEPFCDKDHSYMPIGHIVKHGGFRGCLEFVSNLGEDF